MNKKNLLFGILLAFVFGIQNGNAQSNYSIVSATEHGTYSGSGVSNLTLCTQYTLTYTLTTNVAPVSDNVTIHLPYGIIYTSLTSSSGGAVSYSSGTTNPVFNVIGWSGTTLTITMVVQTPSCSWVPANPSGTYTTISGIRCLNNNYAVSTFFTAGTPNIEITPLIHTSYNNTWVSGSSPLNVNPGETGEIVFELKNTGDGGIGNINLNYTTAGSNVIILSPGYCTSTTETPCGNYSNVPAATTNNTILSNSDFSSLLGHSLFYQEDAPIYVHFYFRIADNCINTSAIFNFSLGCGSTNCHTYTYNTAFVIQSGTPRISASDINSTTTPPITNSDGYEGSQAARTATMGFVFSNTGTPLSGPGAPPASNARATDLKVIFSVERAFANIDSSTFVINNSFHVPVSWVTEFYQTKPGYYTYQIDLTKNTLQDFGSNSLTDYAGSGVYDELAEGKTFTVTVNYIYNNFNINSPADFPVGGSRWDATLFADAKYNNEFCTLTGEPTAPLSNQIYSLGNLGSYSYTHLSSSNASIADSNNSNVTSTTANNEPGPNIEMSICPGDYTQNWGGDLSSNDYHFLCPNADYQAIIKVPVNYELNLADPTYSLVPTPCPAYAASGGACGCYKFTSSSPKITASSSDTIVVSPIIEDYTACAAKCSGPNNIVVDFGNLLNPHAPYISAYIVNCFKLPITLSCSCDSEPTGWDQFTLSFNYLCDPSASCSNCYDNLASASTTLFHHCGNDSSSSSEGGNVKGLSSVFHTNYSFSFKRNTIGWDYNNGGNDWSANNKPTMLHLVDTANTSIKLDRAYPGDEIEEKLNGSYAAAGIIMSSVYLNTSWQEITSLGGTQTFLNMEASKSKFMLVDGTYSTTCTATSVPTIINGTVTYKTELDASGVAFINLHNRDNVSIYADIFWVIQTNGTNTCGNGPTIFCPGVYSLKQLQAGFYGTDTNYTVFGPDNSWATSFEILQPVVQQWYDNGGAYVTYCQNIEGELITRIIGALTDYKQDDFPNEFRPYAGPLGSVYITIPTGYMYQPGSGILSAHIDKYVNNPSTNYMVPATNVLYTVAVAPVSSTVVPGGIQYEFRPNWPLLDCKYGANATIGLNYSAVPVCSATSPSYFIAKAQYQTSTQQYDTTISNNTEYGIVTEGLGANTKDTSFIAEYQVNPQINATCPALSPTVLTNTTTFTITISNNSGTNAPDAWISLQQIAAANLWTFDTANIWHTSMTAGNKIHTAHYYNDGLGGHDIFVDYGPLATGSTDVIIVQAKTNPTTLTNICNSNSLIPDTNTIDVIYGNECTYKSITSPDNGCEEGGSSFRVNWYPSTISLTELSKPTAIDLCHKQYAYTFSIDNNDAGTTLNPKFWANIPSGLIVVSSTFSYTDQAHTTYTATATSTTGSTFGTCSCEPGWNIADSALIPQLSSSGEGFQGGTSILVSLVLQTSCAYGGSPINFYAGGATSCGYNLSTAQISNMPDSIYNSCPLTLTTNQTNIKCNGGNAGTATVYASGVSPYSYSWNTLPQQTNQTAIGLSAGSYEVTVKDANGCATNATVTIINATAHITANIATEKNISCFGEKNGSATVTANGGVLPYTYFWNPSAESTETETELSAGAYTVTVTDANGCSATADTHIAEPAALNVSITGSKYVCSGNTVALTSHVSGGTLPYTYSWNSGASTAIATVNPINTTTYYLTVTDANGCNKVESVQVLTGSPLHVTIGGTNSLCPGGSTTLTASATGGNSDYVYLWLPGKSTTQSITVSPNSTTTYTVEVADGCSANKAVDSTTVTINPLPAISFMANHTTGCVPLCIDFKDLSSISSGDITKLKWNFGNGDSSLSANPNYCYPDSGTFNVTLTATSANGCSTTLKKSNMVSVYSRPVANFIYSPKPVNILEPKVQFTSTSYSKCPIIDSYWTFGDASDSTSTLTNPTHTYADTGTFYARLIVVDKHGCMDSITNSVIVNPDFTFYIPDAFTPNGDGINDVFMPKGSYVKDYQMTIYDRWGAQIFSSNEFSIGWNGKTNNSAQICQEDTYVYVINLTDNSGTKHSYIGKVNLLK